MTNFKKNIRKNKNATVSVRSVIREALLARQEHKRANNTIANTAWTTAGLVVPVSQTIVEGDTIAGRSGTVIRPLSIKLNFTFVTATVPVLGRVILFQDRLNVGVDPTVAQVLDGGAYNSTYLPATFQQHRFKILHDKVYSSVTSSAASLYTTSSKLFKEMEFKMNGEIKFNGSANATASNGPGAVYLLFISDLASGAGGYYNYYTTITYTDS